MKNISVDEFKKEITLHQNDESYDFINVCTPEEYEVKHIEGVRSVPLNEIGEHLREFMDKEKIFIHCQSGGRSSAAAQMLEVSGIKAEIINVDGGLTAWRDAGFDINSLN